MKRRGLTATEVLFPVGVFAQGFPWTLPGDVFALSKNYDIMRLVADEQTWGFAWMIAGVVLVGAVLSGNPVARRVALFICGGMFLFVGLSIFLSNPANTAAYPIIVCGLASVLVGVEVR